MEREQDHVHHRLDERSEAAASRELGVIAISRVRAWFVDQIKAGEHLEVLRLLTSGTTMDQLLPQLPIYPFVQDAMNRQMSAERIRRAVVTESTGTREAAINVAEGEKQSAILKAEGQKQSAILQAEGERQSQLLRAEGFAQALEAIYRAAQTVDQKTMTLQYFETLKTIGASPSTKYIFPMEFTTMLSNFLGGDGKK